MLDHGVGGGVGGNDYSKGDKSNLTDSETRPEPIGFEESDVLQNFGHESLY